MFEELLEIASSYVRDVLQAVWAEREAKAEAQGEAKALAEALLRLLDARDAPLTPSTRERIRACRDLAQLNRWFDRALRAHSLEEVLAG